MSRRSALPALAALLLASLLAAQEAPVPTPAATAPPMPSGKRSKAKPARPPVDFTGVWELDAKASQGVVKAMQNASLKVQQNGNRIWIEPLGSARGTILGEEIVVDGQLYEKPLGKDKGTVLAMWGNDGTSLWLEVVNGTEQNPRAAVQRMVWRLRDFGNTWTRQSWTISGEHTKQTFLIFRKRPNDWVPTPVYFPTPTPAPPSP